MKSFQQWNDKSQDESVRHIGPTARDFAAALGVGENDTTISTVDADGVALAAIQGLDQENQQAQARPRGAQGRSMPSPARGCTPRPLTDVRPTNHSHNVATNESGPAVLIRMLKGASRVLHSGNELLE